MKAAYNFKISELFTKFITLKQMFTFFFQLSCNQNMYLLDGNKYLFNTKSRYNPFFKFSM